MSGRETDESRTGIQVIARAASILRSLKNEREGLSLGQIAQRVSLPRSTVQRIVGALQTERLVIFASPERGIRLGPELQSLADAAKINVTETLRPYLIEISRDTKETVDLAVVRGDKLIFLDQVPGTQRLRAVSSIGDVFPLTTTANGKACLALMSDQQIEKVASDEGLAGGKKIEAFLAEIRTVRKTGIAFDEDEHTAGISAAGIAFKDTLGSLYAISVPMPSERFRKTKRPTADVLKRMLSKIEMIFADTV